jgi:hypothetical protein
VGWRRTSLDGVDQRGTVHRAVHNDVRGWLERLRLHLCRRLLRLRLLPCLLCGLCRRRGSCLLHLRLRLCPLLRSSLVLWGSKQSKPE